MTVMFQIVSTLMEEVPAFALRMRELQGESPNIQLKDNPWGHVEHCDANCTCLESDRTGAYVHCLLPLPGTLDSTPPNDNEVSGGNVTFHGIQFPWEYFIIDVSLVPLGHIRMWRVLLSWDSCVICSRAS